MAETPAIELLAPAGNPSVALAAFDAGEPFDSLRLDEAIEEFELRFAACG